MTTTHKVLFFKMNRRKEIAESDTEDDGTAPPKRVRRAYY